MPFGPTGYSFSIDAVTGVAPNVTLDPTGTGTVSLDRITEFNGINEEGIVTDLTALGDTIKNDSAIGVSQFERITLKGYVDLQANGRVDQNSAFARIGRPARQDNYPARTLTVTHKTNVSQAIEVFPVKNKLITSQDDDVMFEAEFAIAARTSADYTEAGFDGS